MTRKLRVLALMHSHLVPPESVEGLSPEEMNNWRMEYDVREALRRLGHDVAILGVGDDLGPIRQAIEAHRPHVCFNLLTHFHDVGAYQAYVVSLLELLKLPYTGCNARGLLLAGDKALSKKILAYHRVQVPKFTVFRRGHRLRVPRSLSYPRIVKSVNEQASMGIAQASIVHEEDSLRARVEFIHRSLGTDAIAEQYIDGRELNIGVLGNERLTVLPVQEVKFENLPEGAAPILTAKGKWDLAYQERIGLSSGRADLPEPLARELARNAKRIYRALGLSGFARIDLRLAADGSAYVLEANPNPDLCRHEDFAVAALEAGLVYDALIQRIAVLGCGYQPAWKRG